MTRRLSAASLAAACVVAASLAHAQGPTVNPGPPLTAAPTNVVPVSPPVVPPVPIPIHPMGATPAPNPSAIPVGPARAGDLAASATDAASHAKTTATNVDGHVYTLARCLALSDDNGAQIRMAKDRLAQTHADLDEVKWAPWSQFSLTGGVAAVPELRGSAVYSPNGDISISSSLGPAWRIGIEGGIPLYTFGKITSATAAKAALVEVALADVERFRLLVHHDVRRAFFGLMLAHDARYLLNLAKDRLADAVAKADDNPEADEADVLRMKTYQAEVLARTGEVEKGERIALAGLRFLTGVNAPSAFDVPDEPIAKPRKPLVELTAYQSSAKAHRPELKMVKAGLDARRNQVEFAKANLYPNLLLGLTFGYSNAPIVAQQTNPFVLNGNFLRYSFGLIFKWNLDLLPGAARVRSAEAQLAELHDTENFALGGTAVEVETAFATARDAITREKYYGEAEQLAKRWLASVSAAMAVGTKEEKELVDPLRYFLTNRFNHLQAVMDIDVAYSSLSVATGDETFAEY
ncbi:MAG: TolC family protein [Polyangiales bacterium]